MVHETLGNTEDGDATGEDFQKVPYSGEFSQGQNFRDFRDLRPKRENKNREITEKIWTRGLLREHLNSRSKFKVQSFIEKPK